jgi:hypothetical protein
VQHDDGTLLGLEALEAAIELIAICAGGIGIGSRRINSGGELDFDRSAATSTQLITTGIADQPLQPRFEPIRIAQAREVAPSAQESLLHCVLGRF